VINADKRQLVWDWDVNCIRLWSPEKDAWEEVPYEMKGAEAGYNPNIGENMYIEEIRNFIEAIEGKQPFINSMDDDHKVLRLLYAVEEADKTSKYVSF